MRGPDVRDKGVCIDHPRAVVVVGPRNADVPRRGRQHGHCFRCGELGTEREQQAQRAADHRCSRRRAAEGDVQPTRPGRNRRPRRRDVEERAKGRIRIPGTRRGVDSANRNDRPVRSRIDALPVVTVPCSRNHDRTVCLRVIDGGEQIARPGQRIAHVDDARTFVDGPANRAPCSVPQHRIRGAKSLLIEDLDAEQRAAWTDGRDDPRDGRSMAHLVHRIVVAVPEIDACDHPSLQIWMGVVDPRVDDCDSRRGIALCDLPLPAGLSARSGSDAADKAERIRNQASHQNRNTKRTSHHASVSDRTRAALPQAPPAHDVTA